MVKNILLACVLTAAGGYLLGSILFGVLISKVMYNDDVRNHGSGNAGMTNVLRTYGKLPAVLTTIGDVGKSVAAVNLGRFIFDALLSGTGAAWQSPLDPVCGAYLAANYLLGQGKNSIFFLSGPERISVATSRTQGLQTAFREKNLPFLKSRILYDNLTFKDGYRALGRILRVQRPPFGIFCSSDIVAIGALSAARDSGYKIPEEISIVGYDNIANDQYLDYPLTTIAQADYQIGSHGMKVLVEMITSKEPYHQVNQIMFEPELIIRKT